MAVQCTNCGHLIPSGQFRCGKCGHVAARESLDDFAGLADLGDLDTAFEPAFDALTRSTPVLQIAAEPAAARAEDDLSGRESIVPKGTFASDTPTAPEAGAEPKARETGEVSKPRDASGPVRSAAASTTRPRTADVSEPVKVAPLPARPPFLASEILREDLSPREPGESLQHVWTQSACGAGLLAVAIGATLAWGALAPVLVIAALAAIDRLVADYARRALLLAAVSGGGLVAVATVRLALGARALDALLAAGVWLLPAALLLRAWHRASRVARAGVAVGVCACLSWAFATSSPSLLALGFEWQSWLPAVCWYLFTVLCLLSLLAFMGDETTGGADAWASGVLGWFGLFAGTRFALALWSDAPRGLDQALALVEPSFAAVCAVTCAQLAAHRLGQRRHHTPSLRPPSLLGSKTAHSA